MGTRSLTHIMDDHSEAVLATVYRQMDGYPTGHGADLLTILKDRQMVNGIGSGTSDKASNGAGCLAATIIAELKNESGIGGIYLVTPGSGDHWEEYTYTVAPRGPGEPIGLKVATGDTVLYEGPADDFDPAATEEAEA